MDGTVLLCGLGNVGFRVLDFLRTAGIPVVAVDQQADPNDSRLFGTRLVKGDFRDKAVLTEAGVREARGVIIITSDDLVNISCALLVRSLNPDVRIVLRMFNQNLVTRLGKAVRNVMAFSVSALSAPILALTALTGDVLAAFPVGDKRRQIAELTIAADSKLIGRRIADLDDNRRFIVLAHTPVALNPRLLQDVDFNARLEVGDKLVVCGDPDHVERLLDPGGDPLEVLWAGKLRRYGRLIARTISEIDLAVKICTVTLITVIAVSMCIYHYALNCNWFDSLYRTVTIIASGSDLGGETYSGWGKVFVSFLRIAGTALIAAFTAIVTNYLLRARLGGVFEIRRIPDRGHIVVCGLGNVGLRVSEELVRLNERVVVVEPKADNPFIATCRRQGCAVVIGDATLPEAMRQARVSTARAVIAATSSDLVNLEIALLVSEIHPKQRVVVRVGDNVLAETVRKAANVKLALSVAELAAPAFVAGLLGDRVQAMFLIGGKMLAVLEIALGPTETRFLGAPLRKIAADYRFTPVTVTQTDGKVTEPDLDKPLMPGQKLSIVATLPDLEQILKRDAASPAAG